MIGCHTQMRGAAADHTQHRRKHAAHRGYFVPVAIPRGRQREIVAEQFVRAVDEMNLQPGAPTDKLSMQRF